MTWFQARALAFTGAKIRRRPWFDRWVICKQYLWWRVPRDATTAQLGAPWVIRVTDWSPADFLATDWTTDEPGVPATPDIPGQIPTGWKLVTSLITLNSFTFSALIDGRDSLHISPAGLWIEHELFNEPREIVVNGAPWSPSWGGSTSSVFASALPAANSIEVTKLAGRGPVTVTQQPSAGNGHEAIVHFDDAGQPDYQPFGDDTYTVGITLS